MVTRNDDPAGGRPLTDVRAQTSAAMRCELAYSDGRPAVSMPAMVVVKEMPKCDCPLPQASKPWRGDPAQRD